jgi:pimeloyl-ACP methyl ester carboxylesterase
MALADSPIPASPITESPIADAPGSMSATRFHAVLGGLAVAGTFVAMGLRKAGKQTVSLYRTIDPDVGRHIVQIPLLGLALVPSSSSVNEGECASAEVEERPVVLVHGLGGSGREFGLISLYLRWWGRKRFHPIRFDSGKGLEGMAADLAAFVREVQRKSGAPKVDVIAHSMGGIIARLALLDHSLESSVSTVVTLGTPHRGTWAARFAGTPVTQDLRPDSPLMLRLNAQAWPSEAVRGVSLWSRNDLMVIPGESGIVEGMEAIEMSPFTHYSYLIDPRGLATVGRALSVSSRLADNPVPAPALIG